MKFFSIHNSLIHELPTERKAKLKKSADNSTWNTYNEKKSQHTDMTIRPYEHLSITFPDFPDYIVAIMHVRAETCAIAHISGAQVGALFSNFGWIRNWLQKCSIVDMQIGAQVAFFGCAPSSDACTLHTVCVHCVSHHALIYRVVTLVQLHRVHSIAH